MPTQYKKNFIVLHHTLTDRDTTTFDAVNTYHKNLWNFESSLGFYIGYHYFITADGTVYQGRADWEVGAHCTQENKNYDSIGICLTGNFDYQFPSNEQLASLRVLLDDLMRRYNIPQSNIKLHRDYATYKTCPGYNIKEDFVKNLLTIIPSQNDIMKLVQQHGDKEVYAVDNKNRRHAILNWDTFQRGIEMGLWGSSIEQVDNLTQYEVGNVIILTPDD